jgi:hypothetical protein
MVEVFMVPIQLLEASINVRQAKRIMGLEEVTLPRHYRHRWGVRKTGVI